MSRVLELALKGEGRTSPNPMVGCVIFKNGSIIAEGWHKKAGSDHAEVMALKKAKTNASGAKMVVNLEPCAHYGRTPPCVDRIIESGIRKIVIAHRDPNPLTKGKSIRKLRRAGIEVSVGCLKTEAERVNRPFLKAIVKGLPFTVIKIAQTLDGKIATQGGQSKWITSAQTRRMARKRRDGFDAILVGINTVLKDNPRLTGMKKNSRLKSVILDTKLRIPESSLCLGAKPPEDVFLVGTGKASLQKRKRLEEKGYRVIIAPGKSGKIDLNWLWRYLAKKDIISVLVEGGPSVSGSVLKNKLADRIHCYIAPALAADRMAKSSVDGIPLSAVNDCIKLKNVQIYQLKPDILVEADV